MKRPHINADAGITMLTAAGTCRKAAEADLRRPSVPSAPCLEEPERRERPVAVPGILKPYISVTRNAQKLHLLGPTGNLSVHRNERYIAAEGLPTKKLRPVKKSQERAIAGYLSCRSVPSFLRLMPLADQMGDARHVNMICIMAIRATRYRGPDLLYFRDHLNRIWRPLAQR
jgi:hypothetical protein